MVRAGEGESSAQEEVKISLESTPEETSAGTASASQRAVCCTWLLQSIPKLHKGLLT